MHDNSAPDYILHLENLARVPLAGRRIQRWLTARATAIAQASSDLPDPDVSIVIRTRNDGQYIQQLFESIRAQIFSGKIEIIVVDTESRDDTATYAKSQGAQVISITQDEFSYPHALNLGFKAAKYPWVVAIVGHSSLTSRLFLRSLSYWSNREPSLGGLYSVPLPNWNATLSERLGVNLQPTIWKRPKNIPALSVGIMGANCSILKREVWEQLGGYDERYAGGGEDRAFAQTMLDNGFTIVRDPLASVYHSHGLNFKNSLKQWLHWLEVAKKPEPFVTEKVHGRRPDLR